MSVNDWSKFSLIHKAHKHCWQWFLPLLNQLEPFEDFLAFAQKIDYGEPLYVNVQLIQIVLFYYF